MTVTRNDAATALHDVDSARRHSLTLFKYGLAGPYRPAFLLWGAVAPVSDCSPVRSARGWRPSLSGSFT